MCSKHDNPTRFNSQHDKGGGTYMNKRSFTLMMHKMFI